MSIRFTGYLHFRSCNARPQSLYLLWEGVAANKMKKRIFDIYVVQLSPWHSPVVMVDMLVMLTLMMMIR